MGKNLGLAMVSAVGAITLFFARAATPIVILACGLLSVWQLFSALTGSSARG